MVFKSKLGAVPAAGAVALVMGWHAVAQAQAPAAGAAAAEEPGAPLEEIIVTSQRRSENLLAVPLAVTAFSERALREMNVTTSQDLAKLTPNLSIPSQSPGGTSNGIVFLRGLGTDNNQFTTDPAIGIYQDGVYSARSFGTIFEFADIERIEVLRGPQGTIYGRNNSGGAIRIISKAPPLDDPDLTIQAGIGSYNARSGQMTAGAPIVDGTLGGRITVLHRVADGWQSNLVAPGEHSDSTSTTAMKGALLWKPSDNTDITLRATTFRDDGTPAQGLPRGTHIDGDLSVYSTNLSNFGRVNDDAYSATVESSVLPGARLTSISAYRRVTFDQRYDLDATPAAQFENLGTFVHSDMWTQELYFTGEQLGALPVEWIAGAFYFHENVGDHAATQLPTVVSRAARRLSSESYAGYLQGTLPIRDDMDLTVGGRYTHDEKSYQQLVTGAQRQFSDDTVTWRGALDYRPFAGSSEGPTPLFYASAQTGFRAGGFDINSGSGFPTEHALTYEAGAKLELLDQRLRLGAAYFWTQYDDLQQSIPSSSNPLGLTTTTIDGSAEGFELELLAAPTPYFSLRGTLATLDTVSKTLRAAGLTGAVLKQSPELSYSISPVLHWTLANGMELSASATYNYRDEYFAGTNNESTRLIAPTRLVDARIAVTSPDQKWELAASGNNLTNEKEPPFVFDFRQFSFLTYPVTEFPRRPATWMLTVTYRL